MICPEGTFCSVGSDAPTPCAPGTFNAQTNATTCVKCEAGSYQDTEGATSCITCPGGYYCEEGVAAALPCPAGTRKNLSLSVMTRAEDCIACSSGTFCPVGSDSASLCAAGTFNALDSQEKCTKCAAGFFQEAEGATACVVCSPGYYCATGAANPLPCSGGSYANQSGLSDVSLCTPVVTGFWAPLGSALPEACPASGFYCPGAAHDNVNTIAGSRPILIPIGGSTREAQVEVIQQDLTLDISCTDYDESIVIAALAEQYGVDPSFITLDTPCEASSGRRRRALQGGGISITITIEPPSTSSVPTSAQVTDLLTAVQTVSEATLGIALGTALGTAVTVSSTVAQQSTISRVVEFVCPQGKWCTCVAETRTLTTG